MAVTLSDIARALRGEVAGRHVLAPGPNHSSKDRSLSITLSAASPDGYVVFSHAGDDWRVCRDYVANALGLPVDRWRETRRPDPAEIARRREAQRRAEERERAATLRKQRQARLLCQEAGDPRETAVHAYLRHRCLDLSAEIAGTALLHHPRCPYGHDRVEAALGPLRDFRSGRIVGAHRTALTQDGQKIGRKMLGTAAHAAVMLDPLSSVTDTLVVGEGIETTLTGRQYLNLKPAWALCSAGAIASLPVLPNVKTLVVIG